jgi:iron complex outermembrane recepter protein
MGLLSIMSYYQPAFFGSKRIFIPILLVLSSYFCVNGMALHSGRVSLSGQVITYTGEPLTGVNLAIFPLKKFTSTNEKGEFYLNELIPGDYRLYVSHMGYNSYDDTVRLMNNKVLTIELLQDTIALEEIIISGNYEKIRNRSEVLNLQVLQRNHLIENNSMNFVKTLERLPGVHAMSIGAGFSKPVIRGHGFNRIVVAENGIKQEGQQWGADHGLEIDQFNIGRVEVLKGPGSLVYGSDAMGGVIEISSQPERYKNSLVTDFVLLAKSVNNLYGYSAMAGFHGERLYLTGRFTNLFYGDYKVPVDTVYYNTWKLPVSGGVLKNTAGTEKNLSLSMGYISPSFSTHFMSGNVYQKTGFFPGAHGIPSLNRLTDDGNQRDIDLPYSNVGHFKVINNTEIKTNGGILKIDLAYQNNHRQEWARFHTHYGNQPAPEVNPDLELDFSLSSLSGNLKFDNHLSDNVRYSAGVNTQLQKNEIAGYNFLLPQYRRFSYAGFFVTRFSVNQKLMISGGIRYDFGKLDIESFRDTVLANFLSGTGLYSPEETDFYALRSNGLTRDFRDFTWSAGFVYQPDESTTIKTNFGKSFRLPGANELASNGIHHGTFRHEFGNNSLLSESGYQLDFGYHFQNRRFSILLSPFLSWFDRYIYLNPSGRWSVLPHAGQIYEYSQAMALISGGEVILKYEISGRLSMETNAEYVFMQNLTDGYPLPFSPPASFQSIITYAVPGKARISEQTRFYLEHKHVFTQNRIARNEESTAGYSLINTGIHKSIYFGKQAVNMSFSIHNIFNTRHFNHLSFYRKINIPEPGRNIQLIIRIPFIYN